MESKNRVTLQKNKQQTDGMDSKVSHIARELESNTSDNEYNSAIPRLFAMSFEAVMQ